MGCVFSATFDMAGINCSPLYFKNLFLFATFVFLTSAAYLLLWFDFLNCNYAVFMRAPCKWDSQAHRFGWGLFLLLPQEGNSQFWSLTIKRKMEVIVI